MLSGLYLHIPFCEHKCSYCDFYSITKRDQTEEFVQLLCRELELRAHRLTPQSYQLQSVFFGGGTPSLLLPEHMERIVATLRSCFTLSNDVEWTMECNPGTVTEDSLTAFRSLGINRLSFGVQSFHEHELRFLERIHSAEQAVQAVDIARRVGFDNINVDLMFALPNQSLQDFEYTLNAAIALGVDHISAYSLIFEEGTPLYAQMLRKEVIPQTEELDLAMYELAIAKLTEAGYGQYEVSNFAKPARECRHNLCYWNAGEYMAVGPSAHGYVGSTRYWNVRNLGSYLQSLREDKLPTLNSEELLVHDKLFEYTFLSLRATGIECMRMRNEFDIDLASLVHKELPWMINEGYAVVDDALRLTAKGYAQCDDISVQLIQALEKRLDVQWRHLGPKDDSSLLPILQDT